MFGVTFRVRVRFRVRVNSFRGSISVLLRAHHRSPTVANG